MKNKKIHFELVTRWLHFYFLPFSYKREVDKSKKFPKYYRFNAHELDINGYNSLDFYKPPITVSPVVEFGTQQMGIYHTFV